MQSWNPNTEEPTKSVYLGLLAIDEAASKEYGAITLDLLLCAGVLLQDDDGAWELADNYSERVVYLYVEIQPNRDIAEIGSKLSRIEGVSQKR